MSVAAKRFIGVLLFAQALFVGSTFNSWVPVLVSVLSAACVVTLRHIWHRGASSTRRSWLRRYATAGLIGMAFLAMAIATTAWRLAMQVDEEINVIYVAIDVSAHIALFASLMIWSIAPQRGNVSMLPLGLVLMLLCVAAGGASSSITAQTTVGLAACLGFAVAAHVILGAGQPGAKSTFLPDSDASGKVSWVGPMVSVLTLSVLMMSTSMIASATTRVLPYVRNKLQEKLDATFGSVAEETQLIGGTRYTDGSTLGEIRRHMIGQPEEIAVRVYANVAPGYLRGTVFDIYERRHWMSVRETRFSRRRITPPEATQPRFVEPIGTGQVELNAPVDPPLERFPLRAQFEGATVNIEVHNDPLKGPIVFLPLTTRWIEANSGGVLVNHHGTVLPSIDRNKPYVAGASTSGLREELDPEVRDLLLQVPERIGKTTRRFANYVCGDASTPREKANRLSAFFQNKFQYSLSYQPTRRQVDPIQHFLEVRHPAHCEYFASATVLALRSAGVPARYVTGYVADEFNEETMRWIARNRDAHAWAEAYDDRTKRWFAVESTPGAVYQSVTEESALQATASLLASYRGDENSSDESIFSRIVGWFASFRLTEPLFLIYRIVQVPLFFALVYILWSRYLKPHRDGDNPVDQKSRKMLRRVDRAVQRYALVRRPSETLYQFADRIDEFRTDDATPIEHSVRGRLAQMSQWYRQYAGARYQGKMPKPLA